MTATLLPVGDEVLVPIRTTGAQHQPKVAALDDGRFVAVWTSQLAGHDRILAQVFEADGTRFGPEIEADTHERSTGYGPSMNAYQPTVAALPGGGFVVAYHSANTVHWQRFDGSHAPLGASSRIDRAEAGALGGTVPHAPKVTSLADGSFVILAGVDNWGSQTQELVVQHVAENGDLSAPLFKVETAADAGDRSGHAVTALRDGGYVVIQAAPDPAAEGPILTRHDIFGQRYDNASQKIGDEFRIALEGAQTAPEIAPLADAGFVVAWAETSSRTNGGDVFARLYGPSGTAQGDDIRLNSDEAHQFQDSIALAPLADGGFAAFWREPSEDPTWRGTDIHGRRFDANGTPVGKEQRINTQVPDWQANPTVAANDGCSIAALWVSPNGQDGSGAGVYGQFFAVPVLGTSGNDTAVGTIGADLWMGLDGDDRMDGLDANDTLHGGDDRDTIIGGDGDDLIFGGTTEADLRDVLYGGDGNDSMDGGHGNDELHGGEGNDTVLGGFGSDTVIGNAGNDLLAGGAGSDQMFGGPGNGTLNGGFGFDRLNGGTGADRFFHLGVPDHASDWIQDYSATDGDVLVFGQANATRSQFQVNIANTPNAGEAGVAEAFVIYRPTGQIMWALIDGDAQTSINVLIGGQVVDLLV